MKTLKLSTGLSKKQIENLKIQLEKVKLAYQNGSENFVDYATTRLYDLFVTNCNKLGINNPEIKREYNKKTKIGRVYTNDLVVIFNEFGTGIKGTQDEWANKHNYRVNASDKGNRGWWYPTDRHDPNPHKWKDKNGQLRALTHGLSSRHMLYDAYRQLQSEFSEIIEMTIGEMEGDLY